MFVSVERPLPDVAGRLVVAGMEVRVERVEVPLGEDDVEPRHARVVVEVVSGADLLPNGDGGPPVHGGEIPDAPEARAEFDGPVDDLVEPRDHVVDGAGSLQVGQLRRGQRRQGRPRLRRRHRRRFHRVAPPHSLQRPGAPLGQQGSIDGGRLLRCRRQSGQDVPGAHPRQIRGPDRGRVHRLQARGHLGQPVEPCLRLVEGRVHQIAEFPQRGLGVAAHGLHPVAVHLHSPRPASLRRSITLGHNRAGRGDFGKQFRRTGSRPHRRLR